MKKNYIVLAFIIAANSLLAQIPAGYYNSATGTGFTLKTQLKNIIDNTVNGLTPEFQAIELSYNDLYITFENSDVDIYYDHTDPNLNIILDMYSEKPAGPDNYEYVYGSAQQDSGTSGTSEGQRFNREHTIPQSVFDGDTPMKHDPHFVIPTDKYVNAQRANFPYGIVNVANQTFTNGSKLGQNSNSGVASGYSGIVFEPIDEFKGDIARMVFYFVTRYEDDLVNFANDNGTYEMFDGTTNNAIAQPFLDILYSWHVNDPVSQREQDRNNAIFARNNNRNPFIDNPGYVFTIWQSLLSVSDFNNLNNTVSIYPNPAATNTINIKTNLSLDVEIYNVLGKNVLNTKVSSKDNEINIQALNVGVYIVKFTSKNGTTTKKFIKK